MIQAVKLSRPQVRTKVTKTPKNSHLLTVLTKTLNQPKKEELLQIIQGPAVIQTTTCQPMNLTSSSLKKKLLGTLTTTMTNMASKIGQVVPMVPIGALDQQMNARVMVLIRTRRSRHMTMSICSH